MGITSASALMPHSPPPPPKKKKKKKLTRLNLVKMKFHTEGVRDEVSYRGAPYLNVCINRPLQVLRMSDGESLHKPTMDEVNKLRDMATKLR